MVKQYIFLLCRQKQILSNRSYGMCLCGLLRGIGMKIEGHLGGNQKDVVCPDLHHSLLDGLLAGVASPGRAVGEEAALHTGRAFLLSVGAQESLHVRPVERNSGCFPKSSTRVHYRAGFRSLWASPSQVNLGQFRVNKVNLGL